MTAVAAGTLVVIGRGHCARCMTPWMCANEQCACHDALSCHGCPEDGDSIFEASHRFARPQTPRHRQVSHRLRVAA